MSLETATSIATLNPANPAEGDPVSQSADHIRMIKQVLLNTFPSLTTPVTSTSQQANAFVPIGTIVAWAPSAGSIPTGWVECVGGTVNRSDTGVAIAIPDLRDKFILGADGSQSPGNTFVNTLGNVTVTTTTNGDHVHSATSDVQGVHSHGGATAGTALTVDQLAPHSHGIIGFSENADSGAAGTDFQSCTLSSPGPSVAQTTTRGVGNPHAHSVYADGAHNHNITVIDSGSHNHNVTINIAPSFYALKYIMKY